MKKFSMLKTLAQLIIVLVAGLLEKICIAVYCLMPIGLFMLLMSFRSKNHKTSALGTFTKEQSEFQHIFPNYILVIVEPNILKRNLTKRINALNNFLHKYAELIMCVIFAILLISAMIFYFFK